MLDRYRTIEADFSMQCHHQYKRNRPFLFQVVQPVTDIALELEHAHIPPQNNGDILPYVHHPKRSCHHK